MKADNNSTQQDRPGQRDTGQTRERQKRIEGLLQHPAIWQVSQQHRSQHQPAVVDTGFKPLNTALQHGGWPLGQLIECIGQSQAEPALITAALAGLQAAHKSSTAPGEQRPVTLVAPPYTPCLYRWQQQAGTRLQLWLVNPPGLAEQLWAAEQILLGNCASALAIWLSEPGIRPIALRKLQLAASHSDCLVFLMREPQAVQHSSPAPLRFTLGTGYRQQRNQLQLHILKQPGNWAGQRINLPWYSHWQGASLSAQQWPVYQPSNQHWANNTGGHYPQPTRPAPGTSKYS